MVATSRLAERSVARAKIGIPAIFSVDNEPAVRSLPKFRRAFYRPYMVTLSACAEDFRTLKSLIGTANNPSAHPGGRASNSPPDATDSCRIGAPVARRKLHCRPPRRHCGQVSSPKPEAANKTAQDRAFPRYRRNGRIVGFLPDSVSAILRQAFAHSRRAFAHCWQWSTLCIAHSSP